MKTITNTSKESFYHGRIKITERSNSIQRSHWRANNKHISNSISLKGVRNKSLVYGYTENFLTLAAGLSGRTLWRWNINNANYKTARLAHDRISCAIYFVPKHLNSRDTFNFQPLESIKMILWNAVPVCKINSINIFKVKSLLKLSNDRVNISKKLHDTSVTKSDHV